MLNDTTFRCHNGNGKEAASLNAITNVGIEVALVPFRGARLITGLVNGLPHVAMKPIAEHLGLDWSSQLRRIKRHPVLKVSMVTLTMESRRGDREGHALPIGLLAGWLFGVQVRNTKPELHELLTAYQAECFAVLDAYWRGGVAVNPRIHDVPDDEPWSTASDERSRGERFAEERARWEATHDRSLVGIVGLTKQKLRALEEHEDLLSKGDTIKLMVLIGMDVRFIFHGERCHTNAERAIRDAYRLGTDDDRAAIRRHAEAVRIRQAPAGWRSADSVPELVFAGADTVPYEAA